MSRMPSLSKMRSLGDMTATGPMAVCRLGLRRLTARPRSGSVTTMTGVAPNHTCSAARDFYMHEADPGRTLASAGAQQTLP